MRNGPWLIALVSLALLASGVGAAGKSDDAKHVVLVVWDGMRPDFVTEKNCPTLWKLAHEGVTFRRHHSTYLSATNVNGTAMATGMQPDHSGLIANQEFRAEVEAESAFDTAD